MISKVIKGNGEVMVTADGKFTMLEVKAAFFHFQFSSAACY